MLYAVVLVGLGLVGVFWGFLFCLVFFKLGLQDDIFFKSLIFYFIPLPPQKVK